MSSIGNPVSSFRQSKRYVNQQIVNGNQDVILLFDEGPVDDNKITILGLSVGYTTGVPALPDDYLVYWDFLPPNAVRILRTGTRGDLTISCTIVEYL